VICFWLLVSVFALPNRFRSLRSSRRETKTCASVDGARCIPNADLDSQCSTASGHTQDVTYDCEIDQTCCLGFPPQAPPTTPPPSPIAIWFHGQQSCVDLKKFIGYDGHTDVITPISPTNDGTDGSTAPCTEWDVVKDKGPQYGMVSQDPWGGRTLPTTPQLTVSGYSLGRRAFFSFLRIYGNSVNRAVLFDLDYDWETYGDDAATKKKGFQIVADWLAGDPTRVFVFAYGFNSLNHGGVENNFVPIFLKNNEALRSRVFVAHDKSVEHPKIFEHYSACLFDNTCAGKVDTAFSLDTYKD